jgi:hypothetical protein
MAQRTPINYLNNTMATNIVTSALTVNGQVSQQQIIETLNLKSSSIGTVTHDFSSGAIWYHSSLTGNFTVALTNVPTTQNKTAVVSLFLNQGATPYYASTLTVNSTAVPIRWPNSALPTPTASKIDLESITLMNIGGAWTAFGQYTSMGTA